MIPGQGFRFECNNFLRAVYAVRFFVEKREFHNLLDRKEETAFSYVCQCSIIKQTTKEAVTMESYWYKCPVCGMTHQVPAYWVSFSPQSTYEFPHMNPETKEPCACMEMELQGDGSI